MFKSLAALLLAAATVSVCPAQSLQSLASFLGADTTAAKVIARQGQVSIFRDSSLWAIDIGDIVQVKQVIVTGSDGYAAFQVSDGSTFEVYPNSQVTFRANSNSLRELVDVWLGRIRIHIQKIGGQPNPNQVHTQTAIISVRGTTFDVAVTDDGEATTVAVEEGVVAVEHRLLPRDGGPKLLNGGEELTVYRNVPIATDRRLDKGSIWRFLADTAWNLLVHTPPIRGGGAGIPGVGGGAGGGPSLPGDTGSKPPAPPPAPPTAPHP